MSPLAIELPSKDECHFEDMSFIGKRQSSIKSSERTASFSSQSATEDESSLQDVSFRGKLQSSMKSSTRTSAFSFQSDAEDLIKSTTSQSITKELCFSTVEIREYDIIIGDNPGDSTSAGTSISLGWEYDTDNVQLHDLDTFEEQRGPRKSVNELRVASWIRRHRLSQSGFTKKEIKKGAKDAQKARDQREKSNYMYKNIILPMQQARISARKKLKRFSKGKKSKVTA